LNYGLREKTGFSFVGGIMDWGLLIENTSPQYLTGTTKCRGNYENSDRTGTAISRSS